MNSSTDTVTMDHEHTPEAIAARLRTRADHGRLGDFVLGAVDGTVTTFAIVAGVAGAELAAGVALVLGLANVLADGVSMAVSNFLKARSDMQVLEHYRGMEERHIDQVPEGEREEVRQIFAGKGFEGETLEEIVRVICSDRRRWVNTMLTEEWGLSLSHGSPLQASVTTFLAFLLAGMIPLAPLLAAPILGGESTFLASACCTAATFLAIGALRGRITHQSAWISSLTTLAMGGTAATLAYTVGNVLRSLTNT